MRLALTLAACGLGACGIAACDRAADVQSARNDADAPTARLDGVDDFGAPLADAAAAGRRADARVVSLNPTATELLFTLGVGDRLVGRSAWDGYPAAARAVPSLGDGIRPNVEALLAARPTLVLLYAAEENRAAAAALARAGVPTLALRVDRLQQFRELTRILGATFGVEDAARTVVDSVDATLARVRAAVDGADTITVVWPLWEAPLLVVGGGSYLDELVAIAGGRNVFGDRAEPSPQVSLEEVARRDPAVVLTGPVGAERMRAAPRWQAVRAAREGRLLVVDTAVTGRPSVNLGMAAASLARLLHPDRAAAVP